MELVPSPSVNFNLLGGASVPAQAQFRPVDVVGGINAAYQTARTVGSFQEEERRRQSSEQDRQVLNQALSSGELDLFTPPGMERALTALRGKVSPELYMQLGERANALKKEEVNLTDTLLKMNDIERKQYTAGLESAMPYLDALMKTYNQDKETLGEVSARESFVRNRDKFLSQMSGKMIGPTTPMFNEEVFSSHKEATQEILHGIISSRQ